MNRYWKNLLNKMAKGITRFWIVEDQQDEMNESYPDFPISPVGPTRLISEETIKKLIK